MFGNTGSADYRSRPSVVVSASGPAGGNRLRGATRMGREVRTFVQAPIGSVEVMASKPEARRSPGRRTRLDAGLLAVPTAMCVEIMGSSCCDGDKASLGDEAALRLQDIPILARLGKHGPAERPDEPDHLAGVDEIH